MKRRKELKIVQVDAFTDTPYGGNPAAVVFVHSDIEESAMHRIAREMNVRETVFVGKSKVADFRFRFMTPKREIDFSGHPTIAAFHALVEEGLAEVPDDVNTFELETNAGVLSVDVMKNESTGQHEVQITHDAPTFMNTYDPKEYAEALGLSLADILSPNPIQTVSTGTPHLMVPVSTMRSINRLDPDWVRLKELREGADYVSIQVFTRDTIEPTSDAHVRHFAPALGVYEDPVSGSGAGCMASYMIRYGLIEPSIPVTSIVIEQGHSVGRPGKVFVEVQGKQEDIKQVKVSGTGVTVLKGSLYL
ncbi:MAG: PhzF family phenazine biosynthesis protein [Candidatus Thorarchaeota archaeon]|nr:MAG: PhzF family phenazine biosynthesis protein [Candidatus Thorarchaeota archaeon]